MEWNVRAQQAQHNTAHREAYTAHLTSRHPPLITAPFTSPYPPHQPVKLPHGQHAERITDPCPARRITRKYRNGVHPSTANRLTASSPKPQGSHTLPSPSQSPSHIPAPPRSAPARPDPRARRKVCKGLTHLAQNNALNSRIPACAPPSGGRLT